MTRKGFAIACLSTALAVGLASWAGAQEADHSSPPGAVRPLGIVAASGDAATGLLSIRGRRLLPPAEAQPTPIVVKLGEQELDVLSASDEEIRVALPPCIVPARYPLQVSAGSGAGSWAHRFLLARDGS